VLAWLPGLVTVTVLPCEVLLSPKKAMASASMPSPAIGSTWPAPAMLMPSTGGLLVLPYIVSVQPDTGVVVETGVELTPVTGVELTTVTGAAGFRAELGELDAPRAEQIGAAYRHDCVSAHRWIADALDRPPAVKLSAPVTVVVAADDPYTAGSRHRYREWQLLADQVDLHELADGGHYFLRTRPAQAAQAVLRADGCSASS